MKRKLSEFIAACELAGVSVDRNRFPFVIRKHSTKSMFIDHPVDMREAALAVCRAYSMEPDPDVDSDFLTLYHNDYKVLENDIVPTRQV